MLSSSTPTKPTTAVPIKAEEPLGGEQWANLSLYKNTLSSPIIPANVPLPQPKERRQWRMEPIGVTRVISGLE